MTPQIRVISFAMVLLAGLVIGIGLHVSKTAGLQDRVNQMALERAQLQATIDRAAAQSAVAGSETQTADVFIRAGSVGQAQAGLQDDLRTLADAWSVKIDYMRPMPLATLDQGAATGGLPPANGVQRLSLRLVGQANSNSLLAFVRDLERAAPQTLIDDLYVRRTGGSRLDNPLEIQFTVTRFWAGPDDGGMAQ